MKRLTAIIILCALALFALTGCGAAEGETAAVESVAALTGVGYIGAVNSYAGKVVSGETAEIKKAADKTVLEVLVQEGDMVSEGDVLFSYDMEAMQLSLDKLMIEKESLENSIAAAESEIAELQKQKNAASSSQQLSYTLQIDSRQADKREAEYNLALKEREIAAMEKDMENTEITAPISGRVMSVGQTDGDDYGMGAQTSDAFITIMDVSAYRVEGHINELNIGTLMEGMPVVLRSRTDAEQVWYGVIGSIDWENPVKSTQSYYMADEMTTSSKYPFYVTIDDTEELMLGQHVYIEPDLGDGAGGETMMLPSYYINDADGSAWVWAASDKDRLEKRAVTLGAYDPDWDEYEIVSGLDASDYIAFPMDTLTEGMAVEYYDESSSGELDDYYYYDDEDAFGGVTYFEYGVGYYEYGPMG